MVNELADIFEEFSLKELMSSDGLQFEMAGEQFEEDEKFRFNPLVNLNGNELLAQINMYELLEETNDDFNAGSISLGLNFEKVKAKLTDLIPDGRVRKRIMHKGTGDVIPKEALAIVKYSGYFEDQDEPFDSTHVRGTTDRYTLNGAELIYGLDIGIQSMKKNEIAIFWIDYTCAYGPLGCPPLIPTKADVMFIVSLVDYLDSGTVNKFEYLTTQEKRSYVNLKPQVDSLFKIAADNFKRKKYKQAIKDYKRIIRGLEDAELENEEEEKQALKSLSRARQNLAVCYNQEDMPRLACIECSAATCKTAKIHFHHGKALIKMGEYKDAMQQLAKSREMDPTNPAITVEMNKATSLYKQYIEVQKKMWSKCLEGQSNKENEEDVHEILAKEFVQSFVENKDIQRQEIPLGIDPTLAELIRKYGAFSGLNIVSTTRFNKETKYLTKPEYV